MRRAKVNYLDKEDMMGHKVGLESHYERYQEEDFERFPEYQKAIPFLTISDEEKLRVEAAQKQEDIEGLEQKNQEIENLLKRVDDLEYGEKARTSQYEKGFLAAKGAKNMEMFFEMFFVRFEMRASESEKRVIWKKIHSKKDLTAEELTEIFGEPHLTETSVSDSIKNIQNIRKKLDAV